MDTQKQQDLLLQYMLSSDRVAAARLAEEVLQGGVPPRDMVTEVLDPAMIELGDRWSRDDVSLSQAFVASKIAEDILQRCLPEMTAAAKPEKGPVVIGNIEDDFHSLGRRIVSTFLTAFGWEVHDLGNDVLAEQFIEKALEVHAPVIGTSAMMQTTALNIRKLRGLLDERELDGGIKLAVGGAVFNWRPQLVEEVGGDGTARTAVEADALFTRLKEATEQGGPPE